uniref:(northern house mosquito) hypothetical protein n=1 Tax=Culex pipiens TaxID=7175 RepID=A0A8D8B8D8_CULPI
MDIKSMVQGISNVPPQPLYICPIRCFFAVSHSGTHASRCTTKVVFTNFCNYFGKFNLSEFFVCSFHDVVTTQLMSDLLSVVRVIFELWDSCSVSVGGDDGELQPFSFDYSESLVDNG